jgi:hypothetical protein
MPVTDGASNVRDPRARAATYARDDIPCGVDSDCCVVTDGCLNSALVVSAADRDTVASLIRSADMTRCTGCIAAFVQVSCNQGKCLGASVDYRTADGAAADPRLAQDHCGSLDGPQPPKRTGSMFGCGG